MVTTSAHTILLVDDDAGLLDSLSLVIETLSGQSVVKARSLAEVRMLGESALACDSAVLDINLGPSQPSGLAVYRWLRDNGFGSKPIAFLTGHARTHPEVEEASRLGGGRVYAKPLDVDQFLKIAQGG